MRRRLAALLAAGVTLIGPACGGADTSHSARAARPARAAGTAVLSLGPLIGDAPRIPASFLGLSLEYSAVEPLAGATAAGLNPAFLELVSALTPHGSPVLRIGGDSTDWAWWPVPGLARPGGVRIVIGPRFASVLRALTERLGARLILGIDLEAGRRRVAAYEASELVRAVGPGAVRALELGNEPELYGSFAWYRTGAGRRVTGRAKSYSLADYMSELRAYRGALPGLPLAGPATGAPRWMAGAAPYLGRSPLRMLTLHRYPLQQCYIPASDPRYPSRQHLLAPGAAEGLALSVRALVGVAHSRGIPVRIDEMGTISCGTGRVGESFASALWALDSLYAMARVGADGVNIHTYPGAPYSLFSTRRRGGAWQVHVFPQYLGMLAFARAAPAGARFVRVLGSRPATSRAWATVTSDGTERLTVINEDPRDPLRLTVRGRGRAGAAYAQTLSAAGLGGSAFPAWGTSGNLPAARERPLALRGGMVSLRLAPLSAVLVRFTR